MKCKQYQLQKIMKKEIYFGPNATGKSTKANEIAESIDNCLLVNPESIFNDVLETDSNNNSVKIMFSKSSYSQVVNEIDGKKKEVHALLDSIKIKANTKKGDFTDFIDKIISGKIDIDNIEFNKKLSEDIIDSKTPVEILSNCLSIETKEEIESSKHIKSLTEKYFSGILKSVDVNHHDNGQCMFCDHKEIGKNSILQQKINEYKDFKLEATSFLGFKKNLTNLDKIDLTNEEIESYFEYWYKYNIDNNLNIEDMIANVISSNDSEKFTEIKEKFTEIKTAQGRLKELCNLIDSQVKHVVTNNGDRIQRQFGLGIHKTNLSVVEEKIEDKKFSIGYKIVFPSDTSFENFSTSEISRLMLINTLCKAGDKDTQHVVFDDPYTSFDLAHRHIVVYEIAKFISEYKNNVHIFTHSLEFVNDLYNQNQSLFNTPINLKLKFLDMEEPFKTIASIKVIETENNILPIIPSTLVNSLTNSSENYMKILGATIQRAKEFNKSDIFKEISNVIHYATNSLKPQEYCWDHKGEKINVSSEDFDSFIDNDIEKLLCSPSKITIEWISKRVAITHAIRYMAEKYIYKMISSKPELIKIYKEKNSIKSKILCLKKKIKENFSMAKFGNSSANEVISKLQLLLEQKTMLDTFIHIENPGNSILYSLCFSTRDFKNIYEQIK